MQDRLTIDRPAELGAELDGAVRAVCARTITVTPQHIHLLDARHACGDFEGVLAALRAAPPAPALPLVLARYVRWSGDLHSVAALWHAALTSLDLVLHDAASPALRHATCTEFAAVATDLGDPQLAARLLGIARTTAAGPLPIENDPDCHLIHDIAFRTLGLEPDAARGRLRLRPRLNGLEEIRVRNIRFGDGSVSLSAARSAGRLTVRVEQEAGAIPLTVLLEPFVRGHARAVVDGQPADLEARVVTGGTILPVQLVLDDARTLVVEEDDAIGTR